MKVTLRAPGPLWRQTYALGVSVMATTVNLIFTLVVGIWILVFVCLVGLWTPWLIQKTLGNHTNCIFFANPM